MSESDTSQNNIPESPVLQDTSADTTTAGDNPITPSEKKRYPWLAILSIALCIASWVAATRSGYWTLALGVAAIVAGAFALGSKRHAIRNTAITSIIATAVLVLVVGAFMIALNKLLD